MLTMAGDKLTVLLAKSDAGDARELIERLKKAAKRQKVFAQAFDPDAVVSPRHLELAHALAKKAFENGENRARTVENETLARAAATTRIEEAIPKIGAKNPKKFILITDARGKKLQRLLHEIGASGRKPAFRPDKKRVCAIFGIDGKLLQNYKLEELAMEGVAMARAKP